MEEVKKLSKRELKSYIKISEDIAATYEESLKKGESAPGIAQGAFKWREHMADMAARFRKDADNGRAELRRREELKNS